MKKKDSIYIALAAGLAVAGIVGYLLASGSGKDLAKRFKMKGKKLSAEMEDVIESAKQNLDNWKEQLQKECADSEKEYA